ncbi:MAG: dihydrolipoyllysine-residue succinyltransferase [Gammaproteobacteria bacterium]|nr:dihydrolipoyllysine-residue succinyltransferase [Gammaproteobacteria bacterium]MAY01511.1 dihydrolipoyllysine-residue succinyltransferase [Gammaproteobacteria bacterium]|tara:strand:- start:81 stop:1319 length:1239 start_codon:yes stop_codon:yes gene_type:complete
MAIEIKAPTLPESVPDGTIATWYKQEGESVSRDELLVDIETDKVLLEVVAPENGVLQKIQKGEGDTIVSNELLALFEAGDAPAKAPDKSEDKAEEKPAPVAEPVVDNSNVEVLMSPAAKKLVEENSLDANSIKGSGKDGRVTKEDVLQHLESASSSAEVSAPAAAPVSSSTTPQPVSDDRAEERVPMTRLRAKVAERLLQATNTTAMLTTFNEVNMQPVMDLRNKYKEMFEKKHEGTRLGFMSFFVRASIEALKQYPAVNASIDGNDIIYHGYQDIGVAVSSPRGLVVPVLRDADAMGLADIESTIRGFGEKARDGKLTIEEMTGGTFTISNGGVFGSLLSTPILNPPQTAILGMHKIQERPMAVDGEVKILPMMYLALSYDHRMIDGKEAVQFLVTIKDLLEDPARILLEV